MHHLILEKHLIRCAQQRMRPWNPDRDKEKDPICLLLVLKRERPCSRKICGESPLSVSYVSPLPAQVCTPTGLSKDAGHRGTGRAPPETAGVSDQCSSHGRHFHSSKTYSVTLTTLFAHCRRSTFLSSYISYPAPTAMRIIPRCILLRYGITARCYQSRH